MSKPAFIEISKAVRAKYKKELPFIAAMVKFPQREDVVRALLKYMEFKKNLAAMSDQILFVGNYRGEHIFKGLLGIPPRPEVRLTCDKDCEGQCGQVCPVVSESKQKLKEWSEAVMKARRTAPEIENIEILSITTPRYEGHHAYFQLGPDEYRTCVAGEVFDVPAGFRFEKEPQLTHPSCAEKNICQETEGFKGTEHEGLDMCEDGCVLADPKKFTLRLVKIEGFQQEPTGPGLMKFTKNKNYNTPENLNRDNPIVGFQEVKEGQVDHQKRILHLTIIDTLWEWVDENERESVPRRGFYDFAERLTQKLSQHFTIQYKK